MKKLILTTLILIILAGQNVFAVPVNEDLYLINQTGKSILAANHLPSADFIITKIPDTFDDYFIKANVYKTVEMFTWELSFANDEGELAAVIAHQIGKISNNMPTVARSQAKTNSIKFTDRKGKEIASFERKHIYSYEKLNKDKVDLAADRTAVDFMIQSGYNPLALMSVYGRYLDYDEDAATEHIMNIYDYINYNFPDKLKFGYPTATYEKALKTVNTKLASRTQIDNQKVLQEQAKIKEKKLKQANSTFKTFNPWNSSYTTLLLHK
ncbi:MAG: hypothetical protein K6C94_03690 [Candidatus Gastranaerophilales bacterium]|nr:hypothetical protein [Candidatus Gastranaerophilales bacterium]